MVLIPIKQYERLLKRKHTSAVRREKIRSDLRTRRAAAATRYSRKTKNRQVDSIEIWLTMNKTKYLQQIYFDSSHPAAYSSEEKLYRWVKE